MSPRAAAAPLALSHLPAGRLLQRRCACGGTCPRCRKQVRRKAAGKAAAAPVLPGSVRQVLQEPGRPLEGPVREAMESRFQHDFSRVRIHGGGLAAQSAAEMDALAFTVGDHIVFGHGAFRPQEAAGQRLLAHELAHTVQQRGSADPGPEGLQVGPVEDAAEREADAAADRVMAGFGPGPLESGGAGILRRRVSPQLPRLREDLRTGIFNSVSEEEAHDALGILSGLSDTDLGDTMEALEADPDAVDHFYGGLSQADIRDHQDDLRRIKNHRVYTRTTTTGGVTQTTVLRGSCNFDQSAAIQQAAQDALQWLTRALARLDAYRAAPGEAAQRPVRDALQATFSSTAGDVVAHVRARLAQVRTDIQGMPGFTFECHGSWDTTCPSADAYVPGGDPERIVFCSSYFGSDAPTRTSTVVHEFTHTQVGGQHITDRAYLQNRLIARIPTPEALTNAASYERLVRILATGTDPAAPVRDSFEDCPADWQEQLRDAAARTERYNRNANVHLGGTTAANAATRLTAAERALLPGLAQTDLDRALHLYREAEGKFGSGISYECEPDGGGRCDTSATYWYALGDFHICPSWHALATPAARHDAFLAGLYGYWGLEDNDHRRFGYAQLARSLTERLWSAPTMPQVLGAPGWGPDSLRIFITAQAPASIQGHVFYLDGQGSRLLSAELPRYEGPDCHSDPLPLEFDLLFAVDTAAHPRPLPFTPPQARVDVAFQAPSGAFTRHHEELRARYQGANTALGTRFPTHFPFMLGGNGTFQLTATLQDPDSGLIRTFTDTLQIVADRPCAAASLVSDPRAHVAAGDRPAVQQILAFLRDARTRIQSLLAAPPSGQAWIQAANPHIQSLQALLDRLIADLDQGRLILRFDQSASGSTAARYEPLDDTMHLRPLGGADGLPILASSLVHEYAHALQDESLEQIQITQRRMAVHDRRSELQQEIEGRRQESYFLRLLTESGVSAGADQAGFDADLSSRVWVDRFERERTGPTRRRRAATQEIERELSGPYQSQLQANAPSALYPLEITEANHAVLHRTVAGADVPEDLGALPASLQTLDQLTRHLADLVSAATFFPALFQGADGTAYVHAQFTVFYRTRRIGQFALAPPPAAPPSNP